MNSLNKLVMSLRFMGLESVSISQFLHQNQVRVLGSNG